YNVDKEQFEIQHNNIDLSIDDISSSSKMKQAKKILKQISKSMESYSDMAKKYAAKELLTVKNENWPEENENELSEYEFIERLNLISVNIQEDGIVFVFDDNDLFWGHYIECEFDVDFNAVSVLLVD
ncbi:MAG: DUF2262 domain-containing protein, partial [Firmicutes bacterium]|nr:DUF2262 domain-containing protein [Bacillota bacterium]